MDDELKRRKERRRLGAEKKELELKEEKEEVISGNVDNEIVNDHDEIVEDSKEVPINEEIQDNVEKEEFISGNVDNEIVNDHEEIIEDSKEEPINEELQENIEKEESTSKIDKDFIEVEKKKGGFFRILFRIIGVLIFLFILFETVLGIINMNQLNNDKEPVWYFSKNTTKANGKGETTYNLGLYVIVNTTQGKEKKIALKPFFLK